MAKTLESVVSRAQTPFKNAPYTDFSKPENRRAQEEALEQVKSEFGRTYPLVIGGKQITNEATFASVNPAQPDQVIGYFSRATIEQVKPLSKSYMLAEWESATMGTPEANASISTRPNGSCLAG